MKKITVIILLAFAMLLVLAGIGVSLLFVFRGGGVVFNRSLLYAQAEETKTLNTTGPVTLTVHDDAGKVTVTGGEGKQVSVRVVKTGSAFTLPGAENDLKNIKYDIKQDGNSITLTYKIDNPNLGDHVDTVDFIVSVPSETSVDIEAQFGEVSVAGTDGTVKIVDKFGEVTVENIAGGVNVDTQSGQVNASSIDAGSDNIELTSGFGEVSLEKASAKDVRLDSSSGGLQMNEVQASGSVEMNTDFGDARFESGSANELSVETNSGKVGLKTLSVQGAVTAKSEFGEISVERVTAASYDLQTNSGSITVDGVSGKVKAHSGFGSVTVQNAESVTLDLSTQSGSVVFEGSLGTGPHSLHSDFGEITMTIPADSALNVDLTTKFGSIQSDIPITVVLSGNTQKEHQTGTMNGGGEQLTVETDSGSISITASH